VALVGGDGKSCPWSKSALRYFDAVRRLPEHFKRPFALVLKLDTERGSGIIVVVVVAVLVDMLPFRAFANFVLCKYGMFRLLRRG
jgi:hypothetical protein